MVPKLSNASSLRNSVRLIARAGNDFSSRFPFIAMAIVQGLLAGNDRLNFATLFVGSDRPLFHRGSVHVAASI
jgi:hypothetical protein